jgi:predicted transcriptional regulator
MIYTPNIEKYKFFEEHEKYIHRLPEFEQTLIACYMRHMGQKEMALALGCTQGAVSSRLRRAMRRLSFMKRLDNFNLQNLEEILGKALPDPIDLEIIKGMIQTTSQSQTAVIVNSILELSGPEKMNQVKVRHRYVKCLEKLKVLKQTEPKYEHYYILLEFVKNNLYTLSEVKHPRFNRS